MGIFSFIGKGIRKAISGVGNFIKKVPGAVRDGVTWVSDKAGKVASGVGSFVSKAKKFADLPVIKQLTDAIPGGATLKDLAGKTGDVLTTVGDAAQDVKKVADSDGKLSFGDASKNMFSRLKKNIMTE
jgi:phage-related protein